MPEAKAVVTKAGYIKKEDQGRVLAIEALNHRFPDVDDPSVLVRDERQMGADALMDFVQRERTRAVVLRTGEKVSGFLLFDAADADEAKIVRLSVEPRRKGYGSLLLAEAEKLAERAGAKRLSADVYEEDLAAQEFFKAKGFRSKFVRRAFGSRPAFRFTKELKEKRP